MNDMLENMIPNNLKRTSFDVHKGFNSASRFMSDVETERFTLIRAQVGQHVKEMKLDSSRRIFLQRNQQFLSDRLTYNAIRSVGANDLFVYIADQSECDQDCRKWGLTMSPFSCVPLLKMTVTPLGSELTVTTVDLYLNWTPAFLQIVTRWEQRSAY